MSVTIDESIPAAPPPPHVCHKVPEDGEPLLPVGQHSPSIDLETGSKRKARTMAIIGMAAVLVAGVVRRYPIVSAGMAVTVLLMLIFYSAILALLLFLASLLSVLYNVSDQAVFCPDYPSDARQSVLLPSSVGLPCENLRLYAADGTRLHAVFVGQHLTGVRAGAVTLLYLHGNAGNIGHRLANVCGLYNRLKCNVLMLEYRGFGFSSGHPSESGLYQDGAAALDYLHTRKDIDASKIVLFGRSLGGGVAIELASRGEARQLMRGLIIENTFTSIPDMARAIIPKDNFILKLPLCCYKNKFLSRVKIVRVSVCTLVVSGQHDTLVPPRMALQLHQACGARHKRMVRFSLGTHNETWRCPGYYLAIKHFLDEVLNNSPVQAPVFPPGVNWITDASQLL
uniref:Protein ABHD13 n=1 Tax=Hirondellea gigas TaxID=1518452 RepID=A0A2P2I7T5_9CRUS